MLGLQKHATAHVKAMCCIPVMHTWTSQCQMKCAFSSRCVVCKARPQNCEQHQKYAQQVCNNVQIAFLFQAEPLVPKTLPRAINDARPKLLAASWLFAATATSLASLAPALPALILSSFPQYPSQLVLPLSHTDPNNTAKTNPKQVPK